MIYTTVLVKGNSFPNINDANAFCAHQFGSGYRVFEFRDPYYMTGMDANTYVEVDWEFNPETIGFFNLVAYSQVKINTRYWVDIKENPDSNCWKHDLIEPIYEEVIVGQGCSILYDNDDFTGPSFLLCHDESHFLQII